MSRLLVVTAVHAERDAILAALPQELEVVVGGVGPAAAGAAAGAALRTGQFDLVLSAGLGGGFLPVPLGGVVVASRVIFADLGVETADGFAAISSLGFGTDCYDADPALVAELAARTGSMVGAILTVATVTGTAATAARLRSRYPDAAAEGMEGAGVAAAATLLGAPFGELRAISNAVGPRERDAWRIDDALSALGRAVAAVAARPWRIVP